MGTPSSPPAVEQLTVDAFLRIVLTSGLLVADEVQAALQSLPMDRLGDVQAVADHLVRAGKLSRFQSGKLLQGITLGLILGPFHLLAPIGKGGMGAVYLARDSRTKELVAVKVLPPKRARAEERTLARFRREMEMCQRVCHPHLTQTFEVGSQGDVHYIVMEFIRGRNLSRVVTDDGILTVPRAARLFSEVALGLEHAHAVGLIHRDLKPSNIMVQTDDRAKVLDLGLALVQGEGGDRTVVGGAGYVVGTLDYLAPEQAEDAVQVDPRSDIYSLGCTLYFALTKHPPFPGGSALQKMLRHKCDEPPPVEQFNPSVPGDFLTLLRRMMAKRKEDRFASARELREALTPWCDRPIEIPIVPIPERIVLPAPPTPEPPATSAATPEAVNSAAAQPETTHRPEAVTKRRRKQPTMPPADVARTDEAAAPIAVAEAPLSARLPAGETVSAVAPKKSANGVSELTEVPPLPLLEPPTVPASADSEVSSGTPAGEAPPVSEVTAVDSLVFDYKAEKPAPAAKAPVSVPLGPGELPFWLDYLLPVTSCALVLFLAWILGVALVLRR